MISTDSPNSSFLDRLSQDEANPSSAAVTASKVSAAVSSDDEDFFPERSHTLRPSEELNRLLRKATPQAQPEKSGDEKYVLKRSETFRSIESLQTLMQGASLSKSPSSMETVDLESSSNEETLKPRSEDSSSSSSVFPPEPEDAQLERALAVDGGDALFEKIENYYQSYYGGPVDDEPTPFAHNLTLNVDSQLVDEVTMGITAYPYYAKQAGLHPTTPQGVEKVIEKVIPKPKKNIVRNPRVFTWDVFTWDEKAKAAEAAAAAFEAEFGLYLDNW